MSELYPFPMPETTKSMVANNHVPAYQEYYYQGFFERLIKAKKEDETLYGFAKRIGVSYNSLISWKGGADARASTILKLAEKLELSPGWLTFGPPINKEETD